MLFPPLTLLEVVGGPRVEMQDNKPVLVMPLKVTIDQKIMTIEEILERNKRTVRSFSEGIINDIEFDLNLISKEPENAVVVQTKVQAKVQAKVQIASTSSFKSKAREVHAVLSFKEQLRTSNIFDRSADWFNIDANLKSALENILNVKSKTLENFVNEQILPQDQEVISTSLE